METWNPNKVVVLMVVGMFEIFFLGCIVVSINFLHPDTFLPALLVGSLTGAALSFWFIPI